MYLTVGAEEYDGGAARRGAAAAAGPHTAIYESLLYVSAYYYVCVRMLRCTCCYVRVLILLYVSSYGVLLPQAAVALYACVS